MNTPTKPQDAQHVPLSEVDKLRQDARIAAEKRALQTHPDVVALRVERTRSQVDGLMWAGLLLGLAFTMVNVQTFAAGGASVGSLPWVAAWLLDPMVSLVLIAVLRAEQVTARWQVDMRTAGTGPWVKRTKVFAFLATYTMNTWQSWSEGHVAGIVLHSVPPAMVYLAAETGPILRDRLTEAVLCAARMLNATANDATTAPLNGTPSTSDTTAPATVERQTARPRKSSPRTGSTTAGKPRRVSREEYADRARAAYRPGVVITPAWVREAVPEISRGTSKVVADLLNAELSHHTQPTAVPHPAPTPADQATEQERAA
ncbi:MAG: hypothetical protein ACRDSK_05615 [Actinophytocola sp.]|uniref:hypothetical protein n=1 Tax=Actinophytocola sp. TaxID=1872138 RepID=UPI003D6C6C0B